MTVRLCASATVAQDVRRKHTSRRDKIERARMKRRKKSAEAVKPPGLGRRQFRRDPAKQYISKGADVSVKSYRRKSDPDIQTPGKLRVEAGAREVICQIRTAFDSKLG